MRIGNVNILKQLGRNIYIDPPPKLEDFDATNVNLHLGNQLIVWPKDVPYVVDHRHEHISKAWDRHGQVIDLSDGKSYTLGANEKCLAFTQEHIRLPVGHGTLWTWLSALIGNPLAGSQSFLGHLSNRSWAGRSFIRSAVDAFEVKPGTDNQITLEIIADFDIEMYEGMPFIQIGFEQVKGKIFATNGWVHGQTTPSGGQTPRTVGFDKSITTMYEAAVKRPSR
jgi:deoxycytidine triphosphate deaminase